MRRLARRRTVTIVGGIELLLVIAVIAVSGSAHLAGGVTNDATALLIVAFLGAGLIVAYNRPRHRIGWILLGGSGFLLLSGVGGSYSVLDYRVHHGRLPLGAIAVFLQPSWAPAIALLVLSILLYPEGRLPSSRWRWPVGGWIALAAAWQIGAYMIAVDAIVTGRIGVDKAGNLNEVDHPTGGWAWWGVVQDLFFLAIGLILVAWVVSQVLGFRHLTGERRVQQKWILGGAVICALSVVIEGATIAINDPVANAIAGAALVGWGALPVAIAIGILRFRMYEIDRVVSRTVAYAIVSALLAGTFVGLVALMTDLLSFSSEVGVAASTLAAAALFNPLRVRVQRVVDRRFNRARYDAEATVNAFAARLRDAVDLDTVQAELLEAITRAVEPAHATIWIRERVR